MATPARCRASRPYVTSACVLAAMGLLAGPAARSASAQSASAAAPAACTAPVLFSRSVRATYGGLFQVVGGRPDVVRDRLAALGQPATPAWALEVIKDNPDALPGGVIPLFDNLPGGARQPVDIAATPFLQLRLIGDLQGRRLRIEINPATSMDPEQAGTLIGTVAAKDLDPNRWQTIVLRAAPDGQALKTAGVVRLLLEGSGPARVALGGLRFCDSDQVGEWPEVDPAEPRPLRQAMWVWTTDEIWPSAEKRADLLRFAKQHGLTDLYCQMVYAYEDGVLTLKLVDEQRAFNTAAHQAQIKVHALDGAPRYVLPEHHDRMYKLVAALEQFNREGPPDAHYDALHLDNEPYILPEWKNATTRQPVIDSFVELNRELRRRANAAHLEFGIDIPFWFDLRGKDGKPEFMASGPSGPAPLLAALFEAAQNVGIMSYRERVTGPNGIVAVCFDEFALGKQRGVDVFSSVELGTGPNVDPGITFGIYPREYLVEQLETLRPILARQPGCRGLAIHHYDAYRKMEERR